MKFTVNDFIITIFIILQLFMSLIQPLIRQDAAFKSAEIPFFSWNTFWSFVSGIATMLFLKQNGAKPTEEEGRLKKLFSFDLHPIKFVILSIQVQQMEAVLVFMPFWYSHSRPFLRS